MKRSGVERGGEVESLMEAEREGREWENFRKSKVCSLLSSSNQARESGARGGGGRNGLTG